MFVDTSRELLRESRFPRISSRFGGDSVITLLSRTLLPTYFFLLLLYSNTPSGHPAAQISEMYRSVLHTPYIPMTTMLFRISHILIMLCLWSSYIAKIRTLSYENSRENWILAIAITLLAVLTPPVTSRDVFYYSISGEVTSIYKMNPYATPPSALPASPLYGYADWKFLTFPYGPIWTVICGAVVFISGTGPFASTFTFKILCGSTVLLSAFLIQKISSKISLQPSHKAAMLYAMNPIVLVEAAVNAHLDAFIALLLVLTVLLLISNRKLPGYLALCASALIKPTTVPLLGFFVAARIQEESRLFGKAFQLAKYLTVAIVLAFITYYPFWHGAETFGFLSSQRFSPSGLIPLAVVAIMLFRKFALPWAAATSALASLALVYWSLRRGFELLLGRARGYRKEVLIWATFMFLLPVCFYTAYPWYLLPALALLSITQLYSQRYSRLLFLIAACWFTVWTVGTLFFMSLPCCQGSPLQGT